MKNLMPALHLPRYGEQMRRWLLLPALLLMFALASCTTQKGGGQPPSGAFALALSATELTVAKGDAQGQSFTATVTFDATYEGNVRLERSTLPTGVSLLFGGQDINALDLTLTAADSGQPITLQVVADAAASDYNDFFTIIAQGVSESGSTSGKPRMQQTIRLIVQ